MRLDDDLGREPAEQSPGRSDQSLLSQTASPALPFRFPLIQRLPVAFYSDGQNDEGKERDLPKLKRDIDDAIPF